MAKRFVEPHARVQGDPVAKERIDNWMTELSAKLTDQVEQDRLYPTLASLAGWLGSREVNQINMIEYFYFLIKTKGAKPHKFAREFYRLRKIDEIRPHIQSFYCAMVSHDHLIPNISEVIDAFSGIRDQRVKTIALLRAYFIDYEEIVNFTVSDYDIHTGILAGKYRFYGKPHRILVKWIDKRFSMGATNSSYLLYAYRRNDPSQEIQMTTKAAHSLLIAALRTNQDRNYTYYRRKRMGESGLLYYYSRGRYR